MVVFSIVGGDQKDQTTKNNFHCSQNCLCGKPRPTFCEPVASKNTKLSNAYVQGNGEVTQTKNRSCTHEEKQTLQFSGIPKKAWIGEVASFQCGLQIFPHPKTRNEITKRKSETPNDESNMADKNHDFSFWIKPNHNIRDRHVNDVRERD